MKENDLLLEDVFCNYPQISGAYKTYINILQSCIAYLIIRVDNKQEYKALVANVSIHYIELYLDCLYILWTH